MAELKHHSHECVLTLAETVTDGICNICYKDEPVEFSCDPCNFDLCKTCSDLPRRVSHDFHPKHSLEFCEGKNDGRSKDMLCSGCGNLFTGSFYYKCRKCEIFLDLGCAILKNIITCWDAQEKLHYSHAHFLRRCRLGPDAKVCSCLLCELPLSPSAICYGCVQCYKFVHEHCLDHPREIRHPVHQHPLTRLDFTQTCGDGKDCKACGLHIDGAPFGCRECSFFLHMRCADSLLRGLMRESHDPHRLFYVATKAYTAFEYIRCQICMRTGVISLDSYYHCLECSTKFHVECLKIPESVVKKNHHIHPLVCNRYKAGDDSLEYCSVCETVVQVGHHAYSCQECDFVSHVECILHEEAPSPLYLKDLYSSGKRITKEASYQEDCDKQLGKRPVVNDTTHNHVLVLGQMTKYRQYCNICRREIFVTPWKCELCPFVAHDYCVKLGKPSRHGFHSNHLLTLLPSYPAGVTTMNCETCKAKIDGFNLFCRICNFIICMRCVVRAKQFLVESHRGKKFIGNAEGACWEDKHLLAQVMVSKSYLKTCPICDEKVFGKALSCMESCGDVYHHQCIIPWGAERLSHPLYSDHTLNFVKLSVGSTCNACRKYITMFGFFCSICDARFHIKCSKDWVGSEDIESSHEHVFYNYWIGDSHLTPTCSVCSRLCGKSFYGCIDCKLSAHVECIGIPEDVKNRGHQHTVQLCISSSLETCSLCGSECAVGKVYFCRICEDVFHMKCFMSKNRRKVATEEEQVGDIYVMYIERHLLSILKEEPVLKDTESSEEDSDGDGSGEEDSDEDDNDEEDSDEDDSGEDDSAEEDSGEEVASG